MKIRLRHIILLILLAFITVARFAPEIGEWYSVVIYPFISGILSYSVSWIPFSMEEIVVVGAVLLLIFIIVNGIRKRLGPVNVLFRVCEFLLWIYVWFYIGWGCNYFRESLYSRIGVERQAYDEAVFKDFINGYADSLNSTYEALPNDSFYVGYDYFEGQVKDAFAALPSSAGLAVPGQWQHPKRLLFNELYSYVGVLGFIGPFFCETQLNNNLLPGQFHFVYVHEFSHLMGVSSEDEANFWAYRICTGSEDPVLRYSGYYGLLPYVLINASRVLPESDYRQFVSTINPAVIDQYKAQQEYWQSLYSKFLGSLQSAVYNAFLKGNKVTSGTASYIEVIDMIISLEDVPDLFESEFSEGVVSEIFDHKTADVGYAPDYAGELPS